MLCFVSFEIDLFVAMMCLRLLSYFLHNIIKIVNSEQAVSAYLLTTVDNTVEVYPYCLYVRTWSYDSELGYTHYIQSVQTSTYLAATVLRKKQ
jgi:hypothetical protein